MKGNQDAFPKVVDLVRRLRTILVAAGALGLSLAIGTWSPSALAQDPVPCDRLDTNLSEEFVNPICHRSRFAGSHARGWHEQIQAENTRHLVTVIAAKATNSRSYLRGTNISRLYRQFSFPPEMALLSDPEKTESGFEFATVGVPSSIHCFLFLREQFPGRGGYREQQYGLICDKSRQGIYSMSDVETLLSKINFAD